MDDKRSNACCILINVSHTSLSVTVHGNNTYNTHIDLRSDRITDVQIVHQLCYCEIRVDLLQRLLFLPRCLTTYLNTINRNRKNIKSYFSIVCQIQIIFTYIQIKYTYDK